MTLSNHSPAPAAPALLHLPIVTQLIGKSRSEIYRNIAAGTFMRAVKLGNTSAWPNYEVTAIIAAYIAGKSEAEIKQLVDELHADRIAATRGVAA
jgi:prophage regulatory protein